jgi:hypothetical protein
VKARRRRPSALSLAAGEPQAASLEQGIDVDRSGWVALRASGPGRPDGPLPALFAHTAPVYVEVAGAPARSRADARFFLTWIDELAVIVRQRDRVPNAELRLYIQNQLEAARRVYGRIARELTPARQPFAHRDFRRIGLTTRPLSRSLGSKPFFRRLCLVCIDLLR